MRVPQRRGPHVQRKPPSAAIANAFGGHRWGSILHREDSCHVSRAGSRDIQGEQRGEKTTERRGGRDARGVDGGDERGWGKTDGRREGRGGRRPQQTSQTTGRRRLTLNFTSPPHHLTFSNSPHSVQTLRVCELVGLLVPGPLHVMLCYVIVTYCKLAGSNMLL